LAYEYNAESAQSIMAQTAFKGAIDLTIAYGDIETPDWRSHFDETFSYLHDALRSAERIAVSEAKPTRAASSGGGQRRSFSTRTAVDNLKNEFGGGEEQSSLRVVNEQYGPLPEWLLDAAADAGVTAVFDNRKTATGNQPLFKEAVDVRDLNDEEKQRARYNAKAFWAPKEDEAA